MSHLFNVIYLYLNDMACFCYIFRVIDEIAICILIQWDRTWRENVCTEASRFRVLLNQKSFYFILQWRRQVAVSSHLSGWLGLWPHMLRTQLCPEGGQGKTVRGPGEREKIWWEDKLKGSFRTERFEKNKKEEIKPKLRLPVSHNRS